MRDSEVEIVRIAEPRVLPNSSRVDVNYSIFSRRNDDANWTRTMETHSMRHFSTSEIVSFADENGFELLKAEEFKTKRNPSTETWGFCYILKKSKTAQQQF